jgi:hypothetical protein
MSYSHAETIEARLHGQNIAAHVAVGFRALPTEMKSGPPRFVLDYGCGEWALLTFVFLKEPGGEQEYHDPRWGTRHITTPCERCTLLRLVAQVNQCAPADAENFL